MKEPGIYGQSLEVDEFEYDALEPLELADEPLKYVPTIREKACDRCGIKVSSIGRCSGCDEMDKRTCFCGHLGAEHGFSFGYITKMRIEVCGECQSESANFFFRNGERETMKVCTLFVDKETGDKEKMAWW